MKTKKLLIAFILSAILLIPDSAFAAKIKAVASFSIIGDMVKNVGGDLVEVKTLVGANQDAHVFEASPEDAKAVSGANIVFVNGLGFEGWLDKLIRASEYKGLIVKTSTGVIPLSLKHADNHKSHHDDEVDPHAWQSLSNGIIYINNISNALCALDADNAKIYKANADKYIASLKQLDAEIKEQLETIPASKRKAITTHDAFGYFGREYGVEFLAASGINTDEEPSAKTIAMLVEQIRNNKVKALFVENISDKRILEQIKKDSGAFIGGTLYSDALSPDNMPANTYYNMFEHNFTALVEALNKN